MLSKAKSASGGRRLIIIGLIGLIITLGFSPATETNPRLRQDFGGQAYQELYEDLLYPSVRITAGIGIGSGVVIATTDYTDEHRLTQVYILTAAHVVGDYSSVTVTFYTAQIETASVVATDTVKDLALLKIDKPYPYVAKLGSRNYTPYLFTPIYAVGCSLGLDPRPSEGIITVISDDAWEISAPIAPGNSGGGVFLKETRELIGIAVWVRGYREQLITTMAGIVPLQDIYEFLDKANLSVGFSATGRCPEVTRDLSEPARLTDLTE